MVCQSQAQAILGRSAAEGDKFPLVIQGHRQVRPAQGRNPQGGNPQGGNPQGGNPQAKGRMLGLRPRSARMLQRQLL